ncbi:MAG: hypothetical protein ACR2N3_18560 [Pyrinomonadaceae bacterium]
MAADKKVKFDSINLLVEYGKEVDATIKKAVREALIKHKLANNPAAIWRNGKVVLLQPDEIPTANH